MMSEVLHDLAEAVDDFAAEIDDTDLDSETRHQLWQRAYELDGILDAIRELLREP